MTALIQLTEKNMDLLEEFLRSAGNSLLTFRYFNKRPREIIKNHLVTYLILDNEKPVAYGHLDPEDGKTWLGFCVIEGFTGTGLGREMLGYLLDFARQKKLTPISCSTDNLNTAAIKVFEKNNFIKITENEKIRFYQIDLI